MLINGVEYRLRITPYPHFFNGEPAPCLVNADHKEIIISYTGGCTLTLAATAAEAIRLAYEAESKLAGQLPRPVIAPVLVSAEPSHREPIPQPEFRAEELRVDISAIGKPARISGCFSAKVLYPRSFDPQWAHLAR